MDGGETRDEGTRGDSSLVTRHLSLVLIVEDDQISREILQSVVEEILGARAIGAEDGEVGLKLAREAGPDLILLDLRLPKLDGWQVLRELKGDAETAGIPVIVITTASLPREYEQAREAGADDFLPKPFDLSELEEKVRSRLRGGEERV